MGGIQTFLSVGAMVLFAILALNLNRTIINSEEQKIDAEVVSTATALGQNMINEINKYAFDEGTKTFPVYDANLLTNVASLGPESGEVLSTYDDVDDFNNYTKVDSTGRLGAFNLKIKVNYVDENSQNTIVSVKSRAKRIEVAVFSQFRSDTLYLQSYKCY